MSLAGDAQLFLRQIEKENDLDSVMISAGLARRLIKAADPLNDRELSTVLAALRYWQALGKSAVGFEATAKSYGADNPLSSGEIDALCERLNSGE